LCIEIRKKRKKKGGYFLYFTHRIFIIILQKGTFLISTFALQRCGAGAHLLNFNFNFKLKLKLYYAYQGVSESFVIFILFVIQKSKTAKLDMDMTPGA